MKLREFLRENTVRTDLRLHHPGRGRGLTAVALLMRDWMSGCSDGADPAHQSANADDRTFADERLHSTDRSDVVTDDRTLQTNSPTAAPLDPSARYLIIHADDAGMCRPVNRGTIEALEAGVVTSASIMVPCPAFEEFAVWASRHPQYDYGIHLTLNSEFDRYRWGPVLPAKEVPSLVEPGGSLWPTEQQIAANARTDDVERELRAQIDRALEFKVPLSHLDTHMGTLFMRPDLVDVYVQLGADYDLPILFTRDDSFLRQLSVGDDVIGLLDELADSLESRGFPVLDRVLMHYERDSVSARSGLISTSSVSADAGVSEIIVHCGRNDAELQRSHSVTVFATATDKSSPTRR